MNKWFDFDPLGEVIGGTSKNLTTPETFGNGPTLSSPIDKMSRYSTLGVVRLPTCG